MALLCSNCGGQYSIHDDACPDCGQSLAIGAQVAAQPATKQCPYCAETILAAAIKCKHCGERIDAPVTPVALPREDAGRQSAQEARAATSQTSAENYDADEVAELRRKLEGMTQEGDKSPPASRGLVARIRSKWPHFVLIGLCVLAGIITYVVYHETVVRPSYSYDSSYNYSFYRNRNQRNILSIAVPIGMFILAEVMMWQHRRKKRRSRV